MNKHTIGNRSGDLFVGSGKRCGKKEIMAGLNWLHLSDWHQKGNEFDRQVVLKALLKDIREREKINPCLQKIDFVIFSGDIAFSGKAKEYQSAIEQFFEPLLDACGLTAKQLFIVPGNHDLDRDKFELLPHDLTKPLASESAVQSWLTDDRRRSHLLEPFQAFSSFVKDYTGQEQADYANVRRMSIGDIQVALLGLNSAWMCGRNKAQIGDKGFIIVGEPQIYSVLDEISDADLKVAVLHHPFDWLTEFDCNRIETRLLEGCDFILRGHQHKPKVEVTSGTSGNCVIIPAGASYDRRMADNPFYVNSYNFVHLDLDTGKGTVFLRRWSDPRNEWIEDIDSCSSGECNFILLNKTINSQASSGDSNLNGMIGIDRIRDNHVFICYARKDEQFVIKLATNLKNLGVHTWLDIWDIHSGADWDQAIDDGISKCAHFLIILSPISVDSDNVRSELQMAMGEKKHIIPVLYKPCRIPRRLQLIQYADFSNCGPDNEAGLEQVLRALVTGSKEKANITGHWRDDADNDEVFFIQRKDTAIGIYDLGEKRKVGYYIGQIDGRKYEYKWFWYKGGDCGHGIMHLVDESPPILSGRYWDEDNDTGDVIYEYVDDQIPAWLSSNDFIHLWKIAEKMRL
jgi:predicted phosphodiesterase